MFILTHERVQYRKRGNYLLLLIVVLCLAAAFPVSGTSAAQASTGDDVDVPVAEGHQQMMNDHSGQADDINESVVAGEYKPTTDTADQDEANTSITTVLVQFNRPELDSDRVGTDGATIEELQEHAEVQQESLWGYAANRSGIAVERSFWLGNIAVLSIDTDDSETTSEQAVVQQVAQIEAVESVFENKPVHLNRSTPTAVKEGAGSSIGGVGDQQRLSSELTEASGADTTYGLDQINAPDVWDIYDTQGEGTSIAVLDTGVDPTHPDIELAKWGEWEQGGNPVNTSPTDYGSHGTHVSGTATGGAESGTHIGVAPGAELYHGAVLTNCDESGCSGWSSQIIAGIQWAVEQDVDVVSMSLGSLGQNDIYTSVIENAVMLGTSVVAAAGNDGEGTSWSPGNEYSTIGVGASDADNNIAPFSSGEVISNGEEWITPTVAAPGTGIESSVPGNAYELWQGTSMATPHVSGVIALMQSATDFDLSVANLRDALTETAYTPLGEDPEPDTRYGHGIVDATAALNSKHAETVDISGTVTNPDGTPLAGANVSLLRWEDEYTELARTTTDETGAYSLAATPGGYALVAADESHIPNHTTVTIDPGEAQAQDITLEHLNGTVSGTVTDETATPLSDVEVVFLDSSNGTEAASLTTDANGTYEVELEAGSYGVSVEEPTFESFTESVTLEPGSETVLDIELEKQTGTVTGSITTETGDPLADVEVVVLDPDSDTAVTSAVTDEDGAYEVELSVGDYDLAIEELGFAPSEEQVSVEADEETITDIELQSLDPGTVAGTVNTTDEAALADVDVSAVFESNLVDTTTTDDSGAFELVLPPATYTVEAVIPGFQRGTVSVSIGENDTVEQDFELEEGPPELPGFDDPPADLNNDGLFEDVNGDGEFDIFDVQTLFNYLESDSVQNNPEAFNFNDDEDPEDVTVFDVQGLFNRLSQWDD